MKKHDNIKKGLECRILGSDENCDHKCSTCQLFVPGYKFSEIYKGALSLIQQLEAQVPKWISVEERLPEKTITACLVYADGRTQVADWTHDKWGEDWWFYVDGEYDPEITHWMPMPEPPKEE